MRFILLCTYLVTILKAWSGHTHRVVAHMAGQMLSPEAMDLIITYLGGDLRSVSETMANVSEWADSYEARKEHSESSDLHFLNFSDHQCGNYVRETDCPNDQCLVGALANQTMIASAKTGVTDGERATALKFLIHFMADLHQPMHLGKATDRGGIKIKLSKAGLDFLPKDVNNLHALWDMGLPNSLWLQDMSRNAVNQLRYAPHSDRYPLRPVEQIAEEYLGGIPEAVNNVFEMPNTAGAVGARDKQLLHDVFVDVAIKIVSGYTCFFGYRNIDQATGLQKEFNMNQTEQISNQYLDDRARAVPQLVYMASVRLAQLLNEIALNLY